jgi:hypothetical protein
MPRMTLRMTSSRSRRYSAESIVERAPRSAKCARERAHPLPFPSILLSIFCSMACRISKRLSLQEKIHIFLARPSCRRRRDKGFCLPRLSLESERLVRVVFKWRRARIRRRVAHFECRDLALHFIAECRRRRSIRLYRLADWEWIRFGTTSSRPVFRTGPRPHEVVDSAGGYLDGTFFREYPSDVPIRLTPAPKLLYEFAVWLKAGARRLDWQFGQNFFQVCVHCGEPRRSPPNYNAMSDAFLTST